MTLTKRDEGGFWVSGPLVVVIVGGLMSWVGASYVSQSTQLKEDGNDIIQLKVLMTNLSEEIHRQEIHMEAADQTLNTISNALIGLKDANDQQKDQVHALQQQVSDLDAVLRPRVYPSAPH